MASTLVAVLSVTASTQSGLSGSWKVESVGPGELRLGWSMPTSLDMKVDGKKLTGTIRAGYWPGDCPIEGTVEGDRISFNAISQSSSSGGFPRMNFTGVVKGDTVALKMESLAWCSSPTCYEVMRSEPRAHELTATRVR
jgi:hypothetical protein